MFQGFANVWTPVTRARNVPKGAPLRVTLAGESIALFRDAQGAIRALRDRCPHRGVALSLGRVTPDGCLACPFHGWEFDGAGEARHVPLNPDAKRERLHATALPTREIGGLVWVYTAPAAETPEPVVSETLGRPDLARAVLELEWNAHWTRVMENMLDSPHVPFVHRTTIGRQGAAQMRRDSRMEITWEEQPWGGQTYAHIDDRRMDAWLRFYKPNMMELHIPIPGRFFRMMAICVPTARNRTRLVVVGGRDFLRGAWLNPLFNFSNYLVARQDRAVVESSDPPEVPPAPEERSVRTDRVTLAFRKYYFDELAPSDAPEPGRRERKALTLVA